jgi:cytochrome c oxidase subunit III
MTREEDFYPRTALDVSDLPATTFDHRAPLWWGNLILLLIETAMFGVMIAVFVTTAMNIRPFPPPRADQMPFMLNTEPDLFLPIVTLVVLVLSLVPGIMLDRAARRRDVPKVKILLASTLIFNIALVVLRYYEFDALHFKWNENAYASAAWMVLGLHMLHLIALLCEDICLAVWMFAKGFDDKHAVDITVAAVYWYWIVGMWLVLFPVVYLVPRLI